MKSYRILHVDDDALMRDVVELSLGLDAEFAVMSCTGGKAALSAMDGWAPDLILCDVAMAGMDGPALLARLRENPGTAKIPFFFITARAKQDERERLLALGAAAVISKPFYPVKLAETIRRHLHTVRLASAGYDFARRLRSDAVTLSTFRDRLRTGNGSLEPEELQSLVHKLAGAAGIFDFRAVSTMASALEDAIIEQRDGRCGRATVEANLEALLECIAHAKPAGEAGELRGRAS